MRSRITLLDLTLLVGLFVLSLTGWFVARAVQEDSNTVIVSVGGKKTLILSLDKDGLYEVEGPRGKTIVQIRDHRVRVKDSACPRKFCVRQGWVRRGAIICVPNRVVVSVGQKLPEGVDAVSE